MTSTRLQELIDMVKAKLEVEGVDAQDYGKSIECLKKCIAPKVCIEIYEQYINY